jgi:hypothetical protein
MIWVSCPSSDLLNVFRNIILAIQHYKLSAALNKVMVKVIFTLEQATKVRGDQRYSSTLSLTSALDGVGVQRHAPADLPPRKTRCPLYRRLVGT